MPSYRWGGYEGGYTTDGSGGPTYNVQEHFYTGLLGGYTLIRTTFSIRVEIFQNGPLPWPPLSGFYVGLAQRRDNGDGGDPSSITDLAYDWLWHTQVPLELSYTQSDILTPQACFAGNVSFESQAKRILEEDGANFIVQTGMPPVHLNDNVTEIRVCYIARCLYQLPD